MDTILGLPLHPLVVHAVVVLLPLSALGVFLLGVVPRWRPTYGLLVLISTGVATAFVPIATSTGEGLQEKLAETPLIQRHAELGNTALFLAVPLLVVAAALWWLGRQDKRGEPVGHGLALGVAVAAVVISLAVVVQIALIGHSGAEAVWKNNASSASTEP